MSRIKTREVPLKVKRWRGDDHVGWTRAPAFAVNPRGVLTHRVRHVGTILSGGKESHHYANYLCGNGCTFKLELVDEVLVSDPPEDRLLCERCEEMAKRAQLPTGDALAGRHVHVGVLVPKQTCCGGTNH